MIFFVIFIFENIYFYDNYLIGAILSVYNDYDMLLHNMLYYTINYFVVFNIVTGSFCSNYFHI